MSADVCGSEMVAKYGLPPWKCERNAGHDGPHVEGLPSPFANQIGFIHEWEQSASGVAEVTP